VTDQDKPKDRDWDKEMREVDRLLAKLPAPDPGLGAGSDPTLRRPVAAIPGAPPAATTASGAQWLGTWARVTLGLLIGVGMTQWPYTHGCSIRLFFYLIGVGAVITAGVWSSLSSWKRRLGVAHVLSQLLIVWGLLLAAREVLPRVGYARTQAQWLCPGGPPK
jgi:hypothetical protein